MIKMFVGSSRESEEVAKKISRKIERAIPGIVAHHWRRTLIPGKYSLSAIIDEVEQAQLALFLFSADDIGISRDKKIPVPRDNVLLEAGLCLSRLGPRRVALVLEKGVKFPTDLSGLIHAEFTRLSPERAANAVVRQLLPAWGSIHDPSHLGIEPTIRQMGSKAAAQIESLYFPAPEGRRPIVIDSRPCLDAYVDGLNTVSDRFWTTTFLTSGFWTGSAVANVLRANRHMLENLAVRRDVSARRAFMTPVNPEQYIFSKKAEVRKFRQAGETAELREMQAGITSLRKNIERMTEDGFETRVVHDPGNKAWHQLVNIFQVHHRPDDTELAIYDRKRVDLYTGGRHGVTDQVTCVFEGTARFAERLTASESYFEHIWETGESAIEYLRRCEDAIYRATAEIDYTPNWLARYDYSLSGDDERLKWEELKLSTELIAQFFAQRKPRRYLDIGSCTARYPIHLLQAGVLCTSPTIIALENDEDALVVMRAKLQMPEFEKEGVHITPRPGDFMLWGTGSPSKFDLVTCMLGTVSHLAAPGPEGDSKLASAIEKMASALAREGVLILGCWSEEAIKRSKFLGIYTAHDKSLLSRWSPSRAEIGEALRRHGLQFQMFNLSARIDLYFCAHEHNVQFPPTA